MPACANVSDGRTERRTARRTARRTEVRAEHGTISLHAKGAPLQHSVLWAATTLSCGCAMARLGAPLRSTSQGQRHGRRNGTDRAHCGTNGSDHITDGSDHCGTTPAVVHTGRRRRAAPRPARRSKTRVVQSELRASLRRALPSPLDTVRSGLGPSTYSKLSSIAQDLSAAERFE